MIKFLRISNLLSQALQMKSQDILNAMHLISAAKLIFQSLRQCSWDTFIKHVISFCQSHHIDMPRLNDYHMKKVRRIFVNRMIMLQWSITIEFICLML